MKRRQLMNLGYEGKDVLDCAIEAIIKARGQGMDSSDLKVRMSELRKAPDQYQHDPVFGALSRKLLEQTRPRNSGRYKMQDGMQYEYWGDDIEPSAHDQMSNACQLPVSVKAALMPDAHVGYGLPIGGVLATRNSVIPYAVGVDIACRVMLTVLDTPLVKFKKDRALFARALEENTRFGMGAQWREHKQHPVMDRDWGITPITRSLRDVAAKQLGTSGSGNHFVEFGELTVGGNKLGVVPGEYLALVSHSGSRGPGSKVAEHYTRAARSQHPELPKQFQHLAWLDLNSTGAEYWAAMELMGEFASANHHVIHRSILRALGAHSVFQVENHHNYAWKEMVDGEELIVHRKGATPAGKGVGYIPGSMTAPGFLVEGKGLEEALNSCSHGAGRKMSRSQAKQTTTHSHLRRALEESGVHLLSAGLDESPHAYKDIEAVMAAQAEHVEILARFQPRLVKMAPDGEKPED